MSIPQSTIDNIRDQADIVDVVGQYVELKRAGGGNHKGLCPFHSERTPSFNVNAERQIFHCFGCGKGGNVFTFVMELEGVSFPESVRAVGRRVGIEVEDSPERDAARSRNQRFYDANAFAARFFHHALTRGQDGKRARDYLESRGIPKSAWTHFGLGYAPDAWDRLVGAAARERVSREVLVELKLIAQRSKSTGYYDYFRNRVMFPIIRPGGRVVAFGARAMGDDTPKYLNSSESPVFSKRKTFYGVDRARDAIRTRQQAIIVEGYTDLISLHLAGLTESIAACGTALTSDHATALRRMTRRAVLMPDGDSAGENSAMAAGATLLAAGVDVAVARLDAGLDPDTAARELGAEKISQIVAGAIDYFAFLGYIVNVRTPSARDREEMVRRIVDGLRHLDDPLRRDVIFGELSRTLDISMESLRNMVGKPVGGGPRSRSAGSGGTVSETGSGTAGSPALDPARMRRERLALRLLMEGSLAALDHMDLLDADDFREEKHQKLYKLLDLARDSRIDLRGPDFQRRAEETGLDGLAAEIALISVPPGNVETLLNDTVKRIKKQKIEDELAVLRERLMDLPSESEEAVSVAEYYHRLRQALADL